MKNVLVRLKKKFAFETSGESSIVCIRRGTLCITSLRLCIWTPPRNPSSYRLPVDVLWSAIDFEIAAVKITWRLFENRAP